MFEYHRLGFALFCVSTLSAHPNHNATQAIEVSPVPSTQAPVAKGEVEITIEGNRRIIIANGVPDHLTGKFPHSDNPNGIRAQDYHFTIPANPTVNSVPTKLVRQPFGICVNGVLLDPGTAEYWHNDTNSAWHYDANGSAFSLGLDTNNAHVQPNGAYHYHGIPVALLNELSAGREQMTLVGWAADGFPIYAQCGYQNATNNRSEVVKLETSYRLKSGQRPTANNQPGGTYDGIFEEDFEFIAGSGDLDECSGRTGVTPEFPEGTYYYVLTEDFPFIPRYFRGTPDASFAQRMGPPGRRNR